MSKQRSFHHAPDHEEVVLLIPWYVNDTLSDRDRSRVEGHLAACAACRDDLVLERRIHEGMNVESLVEYMPAASLNRLRDMLDGKSAADGAQQESVLQKPLDRRLRRWQWLTAASFAGAAAAVGLWVAGHWLQGSRDLAAPVFYTVTNPAAHPRDEVVRAVFSPAITLVELQGLLDEAQLRIISGPSEAGVYSLAARSNLPVSTSLALLRRHASVRFAEGTEQAAEPGHAP
jgi:anti-sigma factor RsiW